MSVVKKLMVQGVRSFSPNDNKAQTIEFQTPLSLIVGVNGSGKTTIIEALKYAITNQFPPNSLKGSSFVNDPKLTNGMDSMAVVKLEVKDSRGRRVCTSRRVKVTVKDNQGNLTMKQLDSTIRIADPLKGDVIEISNKCADTKAEMCRIMGVSEAILNHVIFCHQEDSCWPLDEGKKVKERFDSIFNTTMYIKCLEQLGKQDKDLGIKLKLEQTKLQFIIENRKIARKKKKDLDEKEIQLKSATDVITKHEKELKEMETKLKNLEKLEREYNEVANQVSETKGKIKTAEEQVIHIKSNIKEEFKGDIPSLQEFMKKFAGEQRSNDQKLKNLLQEYKEKEEDLKKLGTQQKAFILEEGKYQQEKAANIKRIESVKRHVADISEMVKKLKESSQDVSFSNSMDSCIQILEEDPNDVSPETVVRALSTALRARDSEMTKTKQQFEKEETEIQKNINDLRSNKTSLETEIEMKKKQIQENKVSIIEIKQRLRSIEGSNETLALLGDDEQKYVEQIESIKKSGVLEKCDTDVKSLSRDLKDLEKEITDVSENVDLLSTDKNKLDQIAIFSRQKIQKQNECKEILRRVDEDLSNLLGDIPQNDIGKIIEKKRESIAKELNQKKGEQKQRERELTVSETELKRVKTDLEKREAKVEGWKDEIDEAIEDKNFDEVYEELSETLEKSQKETYYSEAGIYLYKKYIQKLNKKDCCPLCKRDIETKKKVNGLILEIEKEVEKMQENEPVEKAAVEKLKRKQQDLIKLKPIWDEKRKLENDEIPALKKKKSELETKTNDLKETIDDLNATVGMLDTEHSMAIKCCKEISFYEQAKKELKKHEDSIAKIEATRDVKAKVLQNTTNLSDATTQLQGLRGSVTAKQIEKDNKADILNKKRNELTKCQEDKNKVREEILRITSELQNREALEVQKNDLEEVNKQLQEKVVELNNSLPKAKTEITEAEKQKSSCVERKEKRFQELRMERDALEKQKSKLNELGKQIEEFEQKKGKFADIQKRSIECKKKIENLETVKDELSKGIDSVKHDISSQEMKQRNLQDNLQCKQRLEEIKKLKGELAEKEKLFQSTQNREVSIERREVSGEHYKLSAKMNELKGTKKEMLLGIIELKKELNDKPFINAEEEYTEKFVKKTVYEKTQKDVRRYKTALDNAIMKFHTKRMEFINQILKDYWRRIYKGNDIDHIQIRTEAPGAKPVAGAAHKVKVETGARARKSYNYRVVMVRRGIELDMRGRCSAGQRVLASIIIRIALAESFSARCGIITLDEPTTNLDQKNINSLADALATLAEKMAQRNNFQLIVITHDQEFTERLSDVDSVEKYWKVSRDNMGFSQIAVVNKRG